MTIRIATPQDAASLVDIYRYYVEETAITFEYEVPSVAEFHRRIETTLERYPYYVVEEEGQVIGYAYAGPFASRAAFAWSCEVSIYLRDGQTKKGYGKRLYQLLEETLRAMGYQNVYACIATPVVPDETLSRNSVDYHAHLGYRLVGEFKKCGYKFNRWYNIVWMEKALDHHDVPVTMPIPFSDYRKENDDVNL